MPWKGGGKRSGGEEPCPGPIPVFEGKKEKKRGTSAAQKGKREMRAKKTSGKPRKTLYGSSRK